MPEHTERVAEGVVESELALLEAQFEKLLQETETWTQAELVLRPGQQTWCALEVLDHLRRCGESVANQAERQLEAGCTQKACSWLRTALLFAIMRSSLRVGVPKASPELHPALPGSLKDALNGVREVCQRLTRLLQELPPQQAHIAAFHHPVGGWMNPGTALRFLSLHAGHHAHQLHRLQSVARDARPRPGQHSALLLV